MSKVKEILKSIIEKINIFAEDNSNSDMTKEQISLALAGENGMTQEQILNILKQGEQDNIQPAMQVRSESIEQSVKAKLQVKGKSRETEIDVNPTNKPTKIQNISKDRE